MHPPPGASMADVSETAREARLALAAQRIMTSPRAAGPFRAQHQPTLMRLPLQLYYASVAEKRNAILTKKAQAGEVRS